MEREVGTVGNVRCDGAVEFLTALSPLFGCYSSAAPPNRNLYRGHSRESYQLTPSVLRQVLGSAKAQIDREIRSIGEFFQFADDEGLEIPADSVASRRRFDRLVNVVDYVDQVTSHVETWPPEEILPLVAIAQHNGIETRLLDWSHDPLVAAYFAAISAAERIHNNQSHGEEPEDNRICVWVLHWEPIEVVLRKSSHVGRVRFITAPASSNRNLHAQKGVFSLVETTTRDRAGVEVVDYLNATPLDTIVGEVYPPALLLSGFQAPLTCVTLPSELAPHVLFCLAHLGVTAASIFPGYGGVARAVLERHLYPRNVVDPRGTFRLEYLNHIGLRMTSAKKPT